MEGPLLSEASVTQRGNSLNVVHGQDNGLIVSFYLEAERQGAESEKAGREIFKDVPYIWIRFPGDQTREVRRRVDKTGRRNMGVSDLERFPRQWAAFENQQEDVHEGTPITEWAPVSKSLALNYKALNIHTVENLAAVPDSALHNMGHGSREMRDKAIAWLNSASGSAELLELTKQNADLREDIDALKAQIADLPKKRGRPKKK